MEKKKSPAPKSSGRKVLLIVLAVLLVLVVAVGLYANHLLNQINYVDKDETHPSISEQELKDILAAEAESVDPEDTVPTEEFTGPVLTDEDVIFVDADATIGGDGVVNVLLVGKDKAVGGVSRTDSIILVTFNQEKNTILMTSFLRDTYVQIPGHSKNRINAAYTLGGMQLLNDTLEQNFGIEIDGNVEIDFSNFRKLINLVGGIEIELNSTEANWINMKTKSDDLTAGVQLLNGKQALWYARFRGDALGDFNRSNRQRIVLNTLINTYKEASLSTLLGLMDDVLPMVTTDFTKEEVITYVMQLAPMLATSEIVPQRIPIDDGYSMAMIDGMSVLIPRIEKNVQFLLETVGGTSNSEEATEPVG